MTSTIPATLYTFTSILEDGRQLSSTFFTEWQACRQYIAKQVKAHGGNLRAIGMTFTQTHRGRLCDYTASAYNRNECLEIANAWESDRARMAGTIRRAS